jgi:hypothetical protein
MTDSARNVYLSSLDARSELNARRLAELSHIPDDDPMWLLMYETQRSVREVINGANIALTNEPFAQRLSVAVATSVARDERIATALTAAIERTYEAATRALRSLEVALHDVVRRRAAAPLSSLAFSFTLGLTVCCAVIWSAYHAGSDYGYNLGYRAGYQAGILYERNRR